jgi:hypothetical protein
VRVDTRPQNRVHAREMACALPFQPLEHSLSLLVRRCTEVLPLGITTRARFQKSSPTGGASGALARVLLAPRAAFLLRELSEYLTIIVLGPRRLKPAMKTSFYRSGEPLRHPKTRAIAESHPNVAKNATLGWGAWLPLDANAWVTGHSLVIDTNGLHRRRIRIEGIGNRLPVAIRLLRIDR